jgi:hypothetical protein
MPQKPQPKQQTRSKRNPPERITPEESAASQLVVRWEHPGKHTIAFQRTAAHVRREIQAINTHRKIFVPNP